ncbi:hypothetical protein FACS189475_06900 [Betaproteobacteria bacterium]|nr:hypothetical protein FACS189475_06900 [Betaproteobacteria bacterium]
MNQKSMKWLAALILPACAFWNIADVWNARQSADSATGAMANITVEWPATWQGQSLRPLALSDVEQRFAQGFPGKIARLTNGRETLIWRHVMRPTRMLHPAADCYRALGWRIRDEQLEQVKNAGQSERWRCFIAGKGQENTLRVCEHIKDSAGQGFTDASAWYWAAVTGQSVGPWQAITVASSL